MIVSENRDGVIILRFAHGRASALDVEFCQALNQDLVRASTARAIILIGSGSIFSAGVDLFRIVDGGAEYVDRFLPELDRTLTTLYELSIPTVAAVNGHAIAGGCIIAAACDYRLMASGKGRIGVPELLVGVPFPAAALNILRATIPPQHVRDIIYGASTYDPQTALLRGLVDEVVEPDTLLEAAFQKSLQFARIERSVYAATKRSLNDALRRDSEAGENDRRVAEIWASTEARDRIRAYLDANVGKKS